MDVLPAPILSVLTLRLLTPSGETIEVDAILTYDVHDPFAVRVGFDTGQDMLVEWTFARELLSGGVRDLTGEGDVRIWPSPYPARGTFRNAICISLSAPGGAAMFEADRLDVVRFLEQTYDLVPAGRESEHLDIDTELAVLFAENWLAD